MSLPLVEFDSTVVAPVATEGPVVPAGPPSLGLPITGPQASRYVLLDTLGRGGMGVVVRAYDTKLGREVALKRLRSDREGPSEQARLLREAQAMARLSHPNVVAVYDVDVGRHGVVLAMELVGGTDMRTWLENPRDSDDILEHFVQAGEGLAAAHAAGLVHRDFKPDNVLIGADGRVRVTDFGIASADVSAEAPAERTTEDASALETPLTEHGVVLGTPAYMAPEQHEGRHADARADQYAFCVALWEALAGELPFTGRGEALIAAKRAGPDPFPIGRAVDAPVIEALVRGLAADPDQRFADMASLLRALRADRSRRWIPVTIVAVCAAVAAGVWAWRATMPSPCERAEAELAQVWTSQRRAAVAQAVTHANAAWGPDLAGRTVAAFDRYRDGWREASEDFCAATKLRGEQSERTLATRTACLSRARRQFAAATDVLSTHDPAAARLAVDVAARLPTPQGCAFSSYAFESDAATEEVDLAAADVHAFLGHGETAQRIVDAALSRLSPEQAPEAWLEAITLRGVMASQHGQVSAAIVDLGLAYVTAVHDRRDGAAARAAAALRDVEPDREAALGHAQLALAWSRKADPEGASEASAHAGLARVLAQAQRNEEAVVQLRDAQGLHEASDPEGVLAARVRRRIGSALAAAGQLREATVELEHSVEQLERALGPMHPDVAETLLDLARVHRDAGTIAEAERIDRVALERRTNALGSHHVDVARARMSLAEDLELLGHTGEARGEVTAALVALEPVLGPRHAEVAAARVRGADLDAVLDESIDAVTPARAGTDALSAALGDDAPAVWDARARLCRVLRRDGSAPEALLVCGRVSEAEGATVEQGWQSRLELARAQADLGDLSTARDTLRAAEASARAHGDALALGSVLTTNAEISWAASPSRPEIEALVAQAQLELATAGVRGAVVRQRLDRWVHENLGS